MTTDTSISDALAIAQGCEDAAAVCSAEQSALAARLTLAARSIRALHSALIDSKCNHTLTTTVDDAMVLSGRDDREPGKYCMTCGERLPAKERKRKPKDDSAPADLQE